MQKNKNDNLTIFIMTTLKVLIPAILFICLSCEKTPDDNNNNNSNKTDSITYPENVLYGNNFLALPDSSFLTSDNNYEIGANLNKDAHLKIVITNLSTNPNPEQIGPIWVFDTDSQGWNIQDYNENNNNQTLISSTTGKISTLISFKTFEGEGICRVDFYENSNTVTKTKYYFW